jgi:hypothetical protein
MMREPFELDEVLNELLLGKTQQQVAEALKRPYGGLRDWLSDTRRPLGASLEQLCARQTWINVGLWHRADEPVGRLTVSALIIDIEQEFISYETPAYVVTPPPDMQLIRANKWASFVYGPLPPRGEPISYWELMANREFVQRVRNDEALDVKIRLAKGILEAGIWFGGAEAKRATDCIQPFEDFVKNWYPKGRWERWKGVKLSPSILALAGTYTKSIVCRCSMQNGRIGIKPHVLKFDVHWNWRLDWHAWLVTYAPSRKDWHPCDLANQESL